MEGPAWRWLEGGGELGCVLVLWFLESGLFLRALSTMSSGRGQTNTPWARAVEVWAFHTEVAAAYTSSP